jgi:hypothetical protein
MHNFIYSIITLHRDPQRVSSIAVLIFRRTICIFTVSGIVTLCMLPYSAPIKSGVINPSLYYDARSENHQTYTMFYIHYILSNGILNLKTFIVVFTHNL